MMFKHKGSMNRIQGGEVFRPFASPTSLERCVFEIFVFVSRSMSMFLKLEIHRRCVSHFHVNLLNFISGSSFAFVEQCVP